jgi:type IV pilus assembly protein PilX
MKNARKNQSGIALYVVIVLVLLTMLLALWASRTAIFNELIVGNDADYQRAYEAAQAMLEDAKTDILMQTNGSTSYPRVDNGKTLFPPDDDSAFDNFIDGTLEPQTTKCKDAICEKFTGAQDFWNDPTTFSNMTATGVGARYGDYTGASAGATGNPILTDTSAGRGAWYWIEVMKNNPSSTSGLLTNAPSAGANAKLLYRITAIARGLKPASQVVLQTTVAFPAIAGE